MIIYLDLHAVGMLYNAYRWHANPWFISNIYLYFAPNGAFLKFEMTHDNCPTSSRRLVYKNLNLIPDLKQLFIISLYNNSVSAVRNCRI